MYRDHDTLLLLMLQQFWIKSKVQRNVMSDQIFMLFDQNNDLVEHMSFQQEIIVRSLPLAFALTCCTYVLKQQRRKDG